ncbi:MAG: hypothetical protein KDB71_15575 [Mycobacterium sp.]|nr:hypothetical protein [Mycobacterium sp.]
MFRELVITAAVAGAALTVAPSATADPSYTGDVPGMAYGVNLNDACFRWDRFIFGRGPGGEAMACHWINNQIYIPGGWDSPPEGVGFWQISPKLYGVQEIGSPCPGSQAAAQSPDGLPMLCLGAQGWQPGFLKVGAWGNGSSFEPAN